MLPINVGVALFGLVFGAAAINAGLSGAEALLMSLIVFSGAAQFTGVTMLAAGANPVAIVITTLALGLRFVLMGASLTPYLGGLSAGWRAFLGFQMVDESYAVAIARFRAGTGDRWFFLGANVALYIVWAIATVLGAFLGGLVPDPAAWGLDLIFPLIFLGLLAPLVRSRADALTAVLAGALALVGSQVLPDKWYLISAALVASLAVAALERRDPRKR
jgi:4-azaleucine resistance transporter AzlC